jgi:hypothetical protein
VSRSAAQQDRADEPQKAAAFEAPFGGNGPIILFTTSCSIFSASFTLLLSCLAALAAALVPGLRVMNTK